MRFDKDTSPPDINEGRGWTQDRAAQWLRDHDLYADKVYEEAGFIRFRQTDEKMDRIETVTTGMPDGVVLTTGHVPQNRTGCTAVDGESVRGKSLSAFLEVALPEDHMQRRAVMRKLSEKADVSLATVHMLVGGKLNCPTRKTLDIFSDVLDVPVDRLISAAKSDGCHYDE